MNVTTPIFKGGFTMSGVFDFGEALKLLKDGYRMGRQGWNGKGMYVEMQIPDEHSKMTLPYLFMFTSCGNRVPFVVSQTDILATDWTYVSF